ncbi:hypothetical protein QA612_17460 [Evansella sp. AB-P1]|uniref:hypothetical protein n=1 Tax=Evansella sp. AB-P1 TaxID=3037653 RepID=UPI00241D8ABC|nr:hypothetical protein [Evansella sp. AB-P1]MDG5789250.1 hypothetical protein [Evansella sp. AB-P1]
MNYYKITGTILIILSAIIYTIERAASMIASNTFIAGWHAGGRTGEIPLPEINTFTDNIFAPAFLILGIALLIYYYVNKSEDTTVAGKQKPPAPNQADK